MPSATELRLAVCQGCGESIAQNVRGTRKWCSEQCRDRTRRKPRRLPYAVRFWALVDVRGPDDCWRWTSILNADGYGQYYGAPWGKKTTGAHRVAYQLTNGAIPGGLELDHLCRVRECVNPAHLEPVTKGENARRSVPRCAKLTHCKRGHEFAGNNVHISPKGQRICRTCKRDATRARRAARHDGTPAIATPTRGH